MKVLWKFFLWVAIFSKLCVNLDSLTQTRIWGFAMFVIFNFFRRSIQSFYSILANAVQKSYVDTTDKSISINSNMLYECFAASHTQWKRELSVHKRNRSCIHRCSLSSLWAFNTFMLHCFHWTAILKRNSAFVLNGKMHLTHMLRL